MGFHNHCRRNFHGTIDTVCSDDLGTSADPRFRPSPPACPDAKIHPKVEVICPPRGDCNCCEQPRRHCPDPRRARLDAVLKFFLFLFFGALIFLSIYLAWQYGREAGIRIGQLPFLDSRRPAIVETPEGGPCRRMVDGICTEAADAQDNIQWSRHYLRLGDAESALKNWEGARDYYRASIDIGSSVGAQAAIYAAKRIQFQSMTCEYTDESLSRIARDFDKNPLGALIEMRQKQQALQSLGYYNAKVDNKHGAETREAVRKFQDDLWFDQKGVLTAEQTTLLVCAAAHIAKDVPSQNVLGIMYAGGLGVRQNTDFALDWLESAAQRGDADAAWNLALMYGTQTVLSSVQVCDAVQNAERADSYLDEAAKAGHKAAKIAQSKYPHDTPEMRWRKLSGDLNKPEAMDRVGRGCNPND